MSEVIAERPLKQFQQKFGESMLEFATHAALPVILNSELLLHWLHINFFYSFSSIAYLVQHLISYYSKFENDYEHITKNSHCNDFKMTTYGKF